MALIKFKNKPNTDTPINDENLNHNFKELENAMAEIVESGSNENGDWIKYADGTMICTGTRLFENIDVQKAWGNIYETEDSIDFGIFPEKFKVSPRVYLTQAYGSTMFVEMLGGTTEEKIGATWLWSPVTRTKTYINYNFLAIGKWK